MAQPEKRMRGTRVSGVAILFLLGGLVDAGGIPAETLRKVKAASVYVKVQFGVPVPGGKTVPGTGSGFVLRAEGDTGYIVTNAHVISPPRELPGLVRTGPIVLVFHSGTAKEVSTQAEVAAVDPVRDLAVLKITGFKDLPAPIALDPRVDIVETMTVYAFGFPFGHALATGKLSPAITVTKGTVSSIRNDDQGNVKLVQIDAEINPGNSGGPVVNEKGELIGIAVSKIDKSRIGFAVPIKPLSDMIVGRVFSVAFDTVRVDRAKAEVDVRATLLDPLGKLKDLTLHYAPAVKDAAPPKPDKDGNFPLLKDASRLVLKLEKGSGVGRFLFEGRGRKEPVSYQTSYINGDGKKVVTAPALAHVDFTQVVHEDKLTKDDPIDPGKGQPRKVYTHALEAGRYYVVEMRGDPKELDPYLRIEGPDGKNLIEDDDAGGDLNSLIVFSPRKAGDHKIIATVLRGTGAFSVRIREESGDEVTAKGWDKKGRLLSSDAPDRILQAPCQTFNIVFHKAKRYSIEMRSKDFDAFLRLENMAGLNIIADDDSAGELNARIIFSPVETGIFTVVATSFDRNVGNYELKIREGGAMDIGPDGLKLAAVLNMTDPFDAVLGRAKRARAKSFDVRLQKGQRYQIDLASTQFDAFLRVEDERGNTLASDDNSGGVLNARLIFTAPEDAVFRVFATAADGRLGQFVLALRKL